jgi:DNA phosphorothioation-dependent restriction protein DptH
LARLSPAFLASLTRGSVAFLRCLPPEAVEALAGSPEFLVAGFNVFGVIDHEDGDRRLITADRAVEFREDKDDPVLLLIDTHRAGAGLDGIHSAGRELSEREIFAKAVEEARRELPRGCGTFSRQAVATARRVGQRNLMTPWQEFDFLVAAADAPGAAVTRLGLWPILADGSPDL